PGLAGVQQQRVQHVPAVLRHSRSARVRRLEDGLLIIARRALYGGLRPAVFFVRPAGRTRSAPGAPSTRRFGSPFPVAPRLSASRGDARQSRSIRPTRWTAAAKTRTNARGPWTRRIPGICAADSTR